MSPSRARPDSSGTANDGTVAEQLNTIDTSVLDELLEKRKEEVRIEEFRQRAETMRATVDPAVWQRVADDYAARLARLSAEAGPLKGQARLEYSRLRTVMDRLTAERRAAETEKAELELRHAVGELSDEDLAERLRGSVAVLERCDADAEAVDALRARFVEAFGTEDAIDAPPEPPSDVTNMITPDDLSAAGVGAGAAVTGAMPAPKPASKPASAGTTSSAAAPPAAAPPAAAPASPAAPESPAEEPSPDATVLAPATPLAASEPDDQTFLLPAAALLIESGGSFPQEYRLAAVNYLGRSDDNHLQIARPGVSRRHAVIVAASNSFTIKDLSSQNGVFVNGARVTEHTLADGEQIVIGDSTMLFRSPWPVPTRRESKSRTRA